MRNKELTIEEGNRLIAEFMGWEKSSTGRTYRGTVTKGISIYEPFQFRFHKSWNWLMPVVGKLPEERYSYHFNDEKSEGILVQLKDALFDADILKTWQAVVQFIIWYNSQ